jgi:DNA-directed RNA polymerase subunit RPC12/RpoP
VDEWMESCYKHSDVAPEAGCDGRMVFKPVCDRSGVAAVYRCLECGRAYALTHRVRLERGVLCIVEGYRELARRRGRGR